MSCARQSSRTRKNLLVVCAMNLCLCFHARVCVCVCVCGCVVRGHPPGVHTYIITSCLLVGGGGAAIPIESSLIRSGPSVTR
uniref:Putative secreted peptide n=1 Tax=Anopheles braziliensis TaxID=58242 RepID=A0A2M3ZQG0_9DIPT